jgi:hypothetical protein
MSDLENKIPDNDTKIYKNMINISNNINKEIEKENQNQNKNKKITNEQVSPRRFSLLRPITQKKNSNSPNKLPKSKLKMPQLCNLNYSIKINK